MKNYKKYINISLILLIFGLFTAASHAQNVSEKLLVNFPDGDIPNSYYVKYDKLTGAYAYSKVDTTNSGARLITAKGTSAQYYGINVVNTFFDRSGNVYCAAYNYSDKDSTTTYYLLKNDEQVFTCEGLTDNWVERNGTLYFKMRENHKEYFSMLDLSSGAISKGKAYDTIFYMYYLPDNPEVEGDPPPYPGFTPGGKYYYGAILDGKRFIVIDGVEQKAYSDIDSYNTAFDKNGTLVYVATDEGSLNDYDHPVNEFIVQGDKEYSKFSYIYGPINFYSGNIPYYIGAQKISSSVSLMKAIGGSTELSKSYSGVSEIQYTASGKLAYTASNDLGNGKIESYIIVDGKESQKYDNVFNLTFDGDTPVFVETKGEKQFVVKGDKKISESFQSINFYRLFKDGTLYYVAYNIGDNTPNKPDENYVFIGDKKLGPFVSISNGHEADDPNIIVDSTGGYIFAGSTLVDKKNNTYKETVYWLKGRSGPFDEVENIGLCNGKAVFMGYKFSDNDEHPSKGKLNIDGKDVGGFYDNISDFEMNAKENKVSFIGVRDGSAYYVEVKL